jgi:hypothetical protein
MQLCFFLVLREAYCCRGSIYSCAGGMRDKFLTNKICGMCHVHMPSPVSVSLCFVVSGKWAGRGREVGQVAVITCRRCNNAVFVCLFAVPPRGLGCSIHRNPCEMIQNSEFLVLRPSSRPLLGQKRSSETWPRDLCRGPLTF